MLGPQSNSVVGSGPLTLERVCGGRTLRYLVQLAVELYGGGLDYLFEAVVQTLAEHWNGHSWSFINIPSPVVFDGSDLLRGVDCPSAASYWAVGLIDIPLYVMTSWKWCVVSGLRPERFAETFTSAVPDPASAGAVDEPYVNARPKRQCAINHFVTCTRLPRH